MDKQRLNEIFDEWIELKADKKRNALLEKKGVKNGLGNLDSDTNRDNLEL